MIQAASASASATTARRPGPRQLRIAHPDELAGLSVYPWRRSRSHGRIRLVDPAVGQDQLDAWEKQLNRAISACGCGEASLGLLTGLLIGGGWAAWRVSQGDPWTAVWLVPFLAAVLMSFAGKAAGLMRGQGRLQRLTRAIRQEWRAPPKSYAESQCG